MDEVVAQLLRKPHDPSNFRWTLPRRLDGRNPDPERELKWGKAFLKVRKQPLFTDELLRILLDIPEAR